MNMPFPPPSGAEPAGELPFARQMIDDRMKQLDIEPLDRADRVAKVGIFAGAAFVGLISLFALLAPLSSAAIASGEVVTGGDPLMIQPLSSGVVMQMMVREGQSVRAGQPLVRLDSLRSGADLAQIRARHDALVAQEARLLAERDGTDSVAFPDVLTSRASDGRVADLLAAERATFLRHRNILSADRALIAAQLTAARAQTAAVVTQRALINDELGGYRDLYAQGFARKTTVRALERSSAQLGADQASGIASVRQAEIQAARTRDSQSMEAIAALAQVRQQLAQIGPQLNVSRYVDERNVMRAPATGRVSNVAAVGPGMVVSGGKTLMELVPSGGRLTVEVRVLPADIDDLQVGQPATLRFSTVNPKGQTSFPGHVYAVSPNSISGEGGSYFKAKIALDDPAAAEREGLRLQPGIPVSANIKSKDRTLAGYLFTPLAEAISRSFRQE